ncbi:MAG: multiheme c-type cytochrome [Chthoniobacteraceae bacterium]
MKRSFCTYRLLLALLAYAAISVARAANDDAKAKADKASAVVAVDRSEYVGAKRCGDCHAGHLSGWSETAHTKMIRPPVVGGANATVLADFNVPSEHRKFELKDVKWVIGSRWKQRFIGEVDGNDVVFPSQWSVKDKKWMPYTAKTDWWGEQHKDWKTRSNFQLCAGCHSTGLDTKKETWAELNISCENCHGPRQRPRPGGKQRHRPHTPRRAQHRQPLHRMPHDEDRLERRPRRGTQPHVRFHFAK